MKTPVQEAGPMQAPGAAADLGLKPLSGAQFREVKELAYRTFGLDLKPGKEALVLARLSSRAREVGAGTVDDYLDHLRGDRTGAELCALIDALTTNYTSFQREVRHFELLRERILPQAAGAGKRIAIWSAGCATGEEPYTILMHASDVLGERWLANLRLLATDISTRALGKAQAGVYSMERLAEVPEHWRTKYLQRGVGAHAGSFRMRRELIAKVEFRRLNLMENFTGAGRFQVIFCRNVMIYFDKATQESLVGRFSAQLEPGGWLMIGHSEGLMGVRHDLEYVMPAVYRKPARG